MVSRFLPLACLAVPGADHARAATGAVQAPLTTSAVLLPDSGPSAWGGRPAPLAGLGTDSPGPGLVELQFWPAALIAFRGLLQFGLGRSDGGQEFANVFKVPVTLTEAENNLQRAGVTGSRYAATV